MLDMVLPEDAYRLAALVTREELEEQEEREEREEQEEGGVMAVVANLALSPLNLIVFIIENWVEGSLKRRIYEKFV